MVREGDGKVAIPFLILDMATHKPLQEHAFWLYGVLVGLAIKAGLEGTLPHIIQFSQINEFLTSQQLARSQAAYGFYPDLGRLIILLILIVRFYLGAAYFFGDVYPKTAISPASTEPLEPPSVKADQPPGPLPAQADQVSPPMEKTNYALDFISGFAHFLAFVILGMTIDVHTKPVSWFPIVVTFILLYDALWWAFSYSYKKTRKIIKWWALVNFANVALSLLVYVILLLAKVDKVAAEMSAYVIVFVVSAYDIGAMMKGRPYFQGLREHLAE